jgi:hypothetical protein
MYSAQEDSFVSRNRSPVHWYFRAMPTDAQRGAIRRLALSGFTEEDIAARTGLSADVVRRAVREDECLRETATMTIGGRPIGLHRL